MTSPARTICIGQLMFMAGIAICAMLMPQFLNSTDQGGISNYGTHARTIIPFTIALFGAGGSLLLAARQLPERTAQKTQIRLILQTLGLLTLLAMITTYLYQINNSLHAAHQAASAILLIAELPAALWCWLRPHRTVLTSTLFGVYLTGVVVIIATLTTGFHALFIAECITTLGLGFLLCARTNILTK